MPRTTTRPTDAASDQPQLRRLPAKKPNGAARGGAGNGGVSSEDIARRAYEIYRSRGAHDGSAVEHWLEAERQLRQGSTSVTGSLAAKPRKAKKAPAADA